MRKKERKKRTTEAKESTPHDGIQNNRSKQMKNKKTQQQNEKYKKNL